MLLEPSEWCGCFHAWRQVDKASKWGDLEEEEEEESEEEEEDEEEDEADGGESLADGMASVASGYNSSLPSGIETPEVLNLRKGKDGAFAGPSLPRPPVLGSCTSMGGTRATLSVQRSMLFALASQPSAPVPAIVISQGVFRCHGDMQVPDYMKVP